MVFFEYPGASLTSVPSKKSKQKDSMMVRHLIRMQILIGAVTVVVALFL